MKANFGAYWSPVFYCISPRWLKELLNPANTRCILRLFKQRSLGFCWEFHSFQIFTLLCIPHSPVLECPYCILSVHISTDLGQHKSVSTGFATLENSFPCRKFLGMIPLKDCLQAICHHPSSCKEAGWGNQAKIWMTNSECSWVTIRAGELEFYIIFHRWYF